ncbi:hypothetical protein [Paenibacillus sp. R14(2021)]|uniref:hypothetical protein n=1 Tax=Paenibacillus sp. R14(2021) TaxID=2859228 RepID=UPI001C614031|nr:hypothetical protein [Paenibacillus sp. R14(2021)]
MLIARQSNLKDGAAPDQAESSRSASSSAVLRTSVARKPQRKPSGNISPKRPNCKQRARARGSTRIVFTTGVLRINPDTTFVLVDLVNMGSNVASNISIQVLDWSTGRPYALPLTPWNMNESLLSIAPFTSIYVYADDSTVEFKYEVRIARSAASRNVIMMEADDADNR